MGPYPPTAITANDPSPQHPLSPVSGMHTAATEGGRRLLASLCQQHEAATAQRRLEMEERREKEKVEAEARRKPKVPWPARAEPGAGLMHKPVDG